MTARDHWTHTRPELDGQPADVSQGRRLAVGPGAVVCDIGGVLTPPPVEAVITYLEGVGVSPETVQSAFVENEGAHLLAELELGRISARDFLAHVSRSAGLTPHRALDLEGFTDSYFDNLELNRPVFESLRLLRERGVRLAVLSNNAREWHERWLDFPEFAMFDVFVNSALVGLRKPDPAIYELTLARLGVEGEACVFMDDLEVNCRTARALGIKAICFESTAQALHELKDATSSLCGHSTDASEAHRAPPNDPRDSTGLQNLYTHDYYLYGVAGHEDFRRGAGGIRTLLNMRRTLGLAPGRPIRRAVDIGSGRGELGKHLVHRGVEVALVDYSAAAMRIARGYIGKEPLAHYLTISATELSDYLEPSSQDAVFMVDFVEHVSREELRCILEQCHRVLTPDGVLCLHSPERTSGAVLSRSAVEPKHINLMDIDVLAKLLEEVFEWSEVFTWNGVQAFYDPGRCIELFGVASPARAYRSTALVSRKTPSDRGWVFEVPDAAALRWGFLLRCEISSTSRRGCGFVEFDIDDHTLQEPFEIDRAPPSSSVLLVASDLIGLGPTP